MAFTCGSGVKDSKQQGPAREQAGPFSRGDSRSLHCNLDGFLAGIVSDYIFEFRLDGEIASHVDVRKADMREPIPTSSAAEVKRARPNFFISVDCSGH